jgi:hypothetical protein
MMSLLLATRDMELERNIPLSQLARTKKVTLTRFLHQYIRYTIMPSQANLYLTFLCVVPLIAPVSLRTRNPASNEVPGNTNTTDSVPTSYSTIFEWDPVPAEQVRGVIRGYTVSYKPVEVFYITRARRSVLDDMHVVNTSSTSVKLEDLLFYTNYSAQVLAYTVGNGVPSSEFHFLTPEGGMLCLVENTQVIHEVSVLPVTTEKNSITCVSLLQCQVKALAVFRLITKV